MKLTELFLIESNYKNGYSKIQYAMIRLWGGILYLEYDNLPSGSGNLKAISEDIDDYLDALEQHDEDLIEELEEWFQEGAYKNDKACLTKTLYDEIMHSAEREIDSELIVYKSGNKTGDSDRWKSFTTDKDGYSHLGNQTTYILPKGTKVIYADGIADKNEIIIHSKNLPK